MKIALVGGVGMLVTTAVGCATVIHGTTQRVRFESTPTGATASAGSETVTTPGELTLSRKQTYEVEFTKEGCVPAHAHIGREQSGAIWGNILLGGLIGLAIDSSNGAAYNLTPTTVSATLVADPAAAGSDSSPPAPAH